MSWGIHTVGDIWSRDTQSAVKHGRWVRVVCEPYPMNWLEAARAAWWVFTGRAVALRWPHDGELEKALGPSRPKLAEIALSPQQGDLPDDK